MKKIIAKHLALAWCAAFALNACGDDSGVADTDDTDASTDAGDDDNDDDADDDNDDSNSQSMSDSDPDTTGDPTTDTDSTTDTTDTDPTGDPECGNSTQEPGEDCDGRDLGGEDCEDQGFDGGALQCNADCTFDTSECTNVEPMCGDGMINGVEQCDGDDLGGQECTDQDFDGGELACTGRCTFDTTNCFDVKPGCGNNTVDPGEDCDGPDLGGQECTDLDFDGGELGCTEDCEFDTSDCTSIGPVCTEPSDTCVNPADCSCNGCLDDNECNGTPVDDCICDDCITDSYCSNPVNCVDDGMCDVFLEGCVCADCAGLAECLDNPVCGDGMIEAPEACEGMNLNGADCTTQGFDGGVLACSGTCQFDTSGCTNEPGGCIEDGGPCTDPAECSCVGCDFDGICEATDDCTCDECDTDAFCDDACTPDGFCNPYLEGCACVDCAGTIACDDTPPVCGDGAIGAGEDCDGANLGGADCTDAGFTGGVLACAADCSFDTSGCTNDGVCIEDGGPPCTDPAECSCVGCDDDGICEGTDDCTCNECDTDAFCATACMLDGACDPYNEGCACADCAGTSACDDGAAESEDLVAGLGLALAVPDDGYDGTLATMACVTLPLVANGTDTVAGVQMAMQMSHTWIGDLTIKVVGPSGTVVTVLSRPGFVELADDGVGSAGDNANLSAANVITYLNGGATDAELMGSTLLLTGDVVCAGDGFCEYDPNPGAATAGDFSAFNGQSAVGNWQVCVSDSASLDTGSIDAVTLTIDQN